MRRGLLRIGPNRGLRAEASQLVAMLKLFSRTTKGMGPGFESAMSWQPVKLPVTRS
jgi:hypothetical protein